MIETIALYASLGILSFMTGWHLRDDNIFMAALHAAGVALCLAALI